MEQLDLTACGASDFGDWKNNMDSFRAILEGISRLRRFKKSLKHLWVKDCGIKDEEGEELMKEFELNEIYLNGTEASQTS
jgi:hypothetical protein